MLQHTLQLSKTLLEYGDKDSPVFSAKRKCEWEAFKLENSTFTERKYIL